MYSIVDILKTLLSTWQKPPAVVKCNMHVPGRLKPFQDQDAWNPAFQDPDKHTIVFASEQNWTGTVAGSACWGEHQYNNIYIFPSLALHLIIIGMSHIQDPVQAFTAMRYKCEMAILMQSIILELAPAVYMRQSSWM